MLTIAGLLSLASKPNSCDSSQGPRPVMDAEALLPTGPLSLRNRAGFIRRAQIFVFFCGSNTKIKTIVHWWTTLLIFIVNWNKIIIGFLKLRKSMFPRTSLVRNAIMGQSTAEMGHGDIWGDSKLAKQKLNWKKFVTMGESNSYFLFLLLSRFVEFFITRIYVVYNQK